MSSKLAPPQRKIRVCDIESIQPSIVLSIADTAKQVDPISNTYPSPVICIVSHTDLQIRSAAQSPDDNSPLYEKIFDFE